MNSGLAGASHPDLVTGKVVCRIPPLCRTLCNRAAVVHVPPKSKASDLRTQACRASFRISRLDLNWLRSCETFAYLLHVADLLESPPNLVVSFGAEYVVSPPAQQTALLSKLYPKAGPFAYAREAWPARRERWRKRITDRRGWRRWAEVPRS